MEHPAATRDDVNRGSNVVGFSVGLDNRLPPDIELSAAVLAGHTHGPGIPKDNDLTTPVAGPLPAPRLEPVEVCSEVV